MDQSVIPVPSPFARNPKLRESLYEDFLNEELILLLGEKVCYDCFTHLETWLCIPPAYTTIRVSTIFGDGNSTFKMLENILIQEYTNRNLCIPSITIHPVISDLVVIHCPRIPNERLPNRRELIIGSECGAAVLRGANVYAPGILGAPHGLQIGDKVAVYVDIFGECRRGLTKPFAGKKIFVGNGIATMNRQQIFCVDKPNGLAVQIYEPLYNCLPLRDILPKEVFLQNLPSVVCGHVVAPKPSDYVLDMCAAPGGKTTHLATIMKNEGILIALDKSNNKVQKIMRNVQLCNLSCVRAYVYDATKAADDTKTVEDSIATRKSGNFTCPPFPVELFDCVLLDAPCSALGQRPQLSNFMTPKELSSYPRLQKKLFTVGEKLLRKGGTLVYSTCTWTIAENEGIVKWALDTFPELSLDVQVPHIGSGGLQGAGLSQNHLNKLQRFPLITDPSSERINCDEDTIGFFIAKFKKNL